MEFKVQEVGLHVVAAVPRVSKVYHTTVMTLDSKRHQNHFLAGQRPYINHH